MVKNEFAIFATALTRCWWRDVYFCQRRMLPLGLCAARRAHLPTIGPAGCCAGYIELSLEATDFAEHRPLQYLDKGTFWRSATPDYQVPNIEVPVPRVCQAQGSLDGPRLAAEVADRMREPE
jgi:hypothetical protein